MRRMPHLPSVKRPPRRRVSRGFIPSSTAITKPPTLPPLPPRSISLSRDTHRCTAVRYTMTENSRDVMWTYSTNLATATTERKSIGPFNPFLRESIYSGGKKNAADKWSNRVLLFIVARLIVRVFFLSQQFSRMYVHRRECINEAYWFASSPLQYAHQYESIIEVLRISVWSFHCRLIEIIFSTHNKVCLDDADVTAFTVQFWYNFRDNNKPSFKIWESHNSVVIQYDTQFCYTLYMQRTSA